MEYRLKRLLMRLMGRTPLDYNGSIYLKNGKIYAPNREEIS